MVVIAIALPVALVATRQPYVRARVQERQLAVHTRVVHVAHGDERPAGKAAAVVVLERVDRERATAAHCDWRIVGRHVVAHTLAGAWTRTVGVGRDATGDIARDWEGV